jgi:hypothetical protein
MLGAKAEHRKIIRRAACMAYRQRGARCVGVRRIAAPRANGIDGA